MTSMAIMMWMFLPEKERDCVDPEITIRLSKNENCL